jgi:hypothetical protein
MANEIQLPPFTVTTTFIGGTTVESPAPAPTQVNDGPTKGNPQVPAGARSITKNTMVGFSNDNLSHVCNFVDDMQKNINLKKYTKAIAEQIRKAIRAVMRLLGLGDATGQTSWLLNTLKSIKREVDYINKQILQPILDFQKYVVAYITKLREILQWIQSLPAKFLAMLQDCLSRIIKQIGSVFKDIGAGLSDGISDADDKSLDELIKESKELAKTVKTTVDTSVKIVAGGLTIAGNASAGLLVPTSEAELKAADDIIKNYESKDNLQTYNRSQP